MLRTPKRCCRSGCSSVLIFTTLSLPARSVASLSTAGLTIRQGPHHGAQKSASTGTGLASTALWKLAVETSASQGSSEPHFAQWGTPEAAASTRFFCPHFGQAITFVSLISLSETFPPQAVRKPAGGGASSHDPR